MNNTYQQLIPLINELHDDLKFAGESTSILDQIKMIIENSEINPIYTLSKKAGGKNE